MRQKRKLDHLNLARFVKDGPGSSGFEDVSFIHNCLPELDSSGISTATSFLGRKFAAPLMINAVSGGVKEAEVLNRIFARVSRKLEIPMAVGSQTAALEHPALRYTYSVAREENPEGFLVANISAGAAVEQALEAVQMIGADALQLHLNAPQEIFMPGNEKEASFGGFLANIAEVAGASPVPVIIKEVGFGMAREQAKLLVKAGAAALDVGGSGGTNFIRIEGLRGKNKMYQPFLKWGLSSAIALGEMAEEYFPGVQLVATGGIRHGLDAAKALALGASMVGMAGPLVRCYYKGGETEVENFLVSIKQQLQRAMFILGALEPARLSSLPLVIRGETGRWLELRGVDLHGLAVRSADQ